MSGENERRESRHVCTRKVFLRSFYCIEGQRKQVVAREKQFFLNWEKP